MRLITAAEGSFPPEQLLPVLQEAQEQHSIHLLEEQVEQNERVRLSDCIQPMSPLRLSCFCPGTTQIPLAQ